MQIMLCALCGKNQKKRLLYRATFSKKDLTDKTFSARRIPDKIHYQLNTCLTCGLIFSSPIFPNEQIIDLYKKSFLSYPDQVSYVTKTYVDLFKNIQTKLAKNPTVLEIGCGDGFFLMALRKCGITKLFGVEPSKPMVMAAPEAIRKNIKQTVFKKKLFPKNFFDLVCCFHTLDHVTDPNDVVKETFTVLKPKGIALFVLHNTSAFSVTLFGEKSPIFDIEHIYLFNTKNIAQLFQKHGFTILEVADVKNTYPLTYWVQMAGIPGFLKQSIQYMLSVLNIKQLPFSLKGGNMYIVAQKSA